MFEGLTGEIQDKVRNEAALDEAQKSTANKERCLIRQPELCKCHDRPQAHLNRDPTVRTKLRGLCAVEKNAKEACAVRSDIRV